MGSGFGVLSVVWECGLDSEVRWTVPTLKTTTSSKNYAKGRSLSNRQNSRLQDAGKSRKTSRWGLPPRVHKLHQRPRAVHQHTYEGPAPDGPSRSPVGRWQRREGNRALHTPLNRHSWDVWHCCRAHIFHRPTGNRLTITRASGKSFFHDGAKIFWNSLTWHARPQSTWSFPRHL